MHVYTLILIIQRMAALHKFNTKKKLNACDKVQNN